MNFHHLPRSYLLILFPFHIHCSTPTRTTYDRRHADRGLVSLFIGSFIIGLGMVISGACPGTIHVQIGSSDQVVYGKLKLSTLTRLLSRERERERLGEKAEHTQTC